MPPIRTQSSQKREEQEGRILLAIQAIKNQEIASIQEVATRFNVPRTTLRRRLARYTSRAETRANSHKLTEIEENHF
jgi:DNA invertase Pin-like site-specific DNA recombinase